jgi:small neutral amino acid transporter SnatA (MarC family)
MTDWTNEFNAVFFSSIASLFFLFLGSLVKYAFKSKCDNVNLCCGLVNIHRAVELEVSDDDEEKSHSKKTDDEKKVVVI